MRWPETWGGSAGVGREKAAPSLGHGLALDHAPCSCHVPRVMPCLGQDGGERQEEGHRRSQGAVDPEAGGEGHEPREGGATAMVWWRSALSAQAEGPRHRPCAMSCQSCQRVRRSGRASVAPKKRVGAESAEVNGRRSTNVMTSLPRRSAPQCYASRNRAWRRSASPRRGWTWTRIKARGL